MKDIDKYGDFTVQMWLGGGNTPRDLTIIGFGLAGEAGEVLEHCKKLVRDNNLDKEALKKELGDAIYYWARLCRYFDFQPSEVLQANVDKLESRLARGTLRGDGDNR